MVKDPSLDLCEPLLKDTKNEMNHLSSSYETFMHQCIHIEKDMAFISSDNPNPHLLEGIHEKFLNIHCLITKIGSFSKIALGNDANSMEKIKLISFNISNKLSEITLKYTKATADIKASQYKNTTIELIASIKLTDKEISCMVNKSLMKGNVYVRKVSTGRDEGIDVNKDVFLRNDDDSTLSYLFTAGCVAFFLIFIIVVSYMKMRN